MKKGKPKTECCDEKEKKSIRIELRCGFFFVCNISRLIMTRRKRPKKKKRASLQEYKLGEGMGGRVKAFFIFLRKETLVLER